MVFFILWNYFWNIWRIHAKYVTNQYIKQISKMWRQWTKPESKDNHFVYLLENAHIGSTFSDLKSPNLSYKILKHFLYLKYIYVHVAQWKYLDKKYLLHLEWQVMSNLVLFSSILKLWLNDPSSSWMVTVSGPWKKKTNPKCHCWSGKIFQFIQSDFNYKWIYFDF